MREWFKYDSPQRNGKLYWISALICIMIFAVIMTIICTTANIEIDRYNWPTYRLQAQAWLRGETALDGDYSALELAVYNGRYYVSFPPVPSIPYLILLPIFGEEVSGGILQKLYLLLACFLILAEIMRTKKMCAFECAIWTIGFCFASAMLPIVCVGGVWFEAEILAFLFGIWAVIVIRHGRITCACVFWALSIGCRPFSICMGPILLMIYIENCRQCGRNAISMICNAIPGIAAGMMIAGVYMWYNMVRFGNPLEFGHNYLPEFTRSMHGQFSPVYLVENLKTMLFASPIVGSTNRSIIFNVFGFSMFLSCPILLINVIWFISDILRHRMTAIKWTITAVAVINVLLLSMHKTVGGWQFGLRYALELVPMCFAWYLVSDDRGPMNRYETALLTFGLILNMIGAIVLYS